jgi:hypothetical protein
MFYTFHTHRSAGPVLHTNTLLTHTPQHPPPHTHTQEKKMQTLKHYCSMNQKERNALRTIMEVYPNVFCMHRMCSLTHTYSHLHTHEGQNKTGCPGVGVCACLSLGVCACLSLRVCLFVSLTHTRRSKSKALSTSSSPLPRCACVCLFVSLSVHTHTQCSGIYTRICVRVCVRVYTHTHTYANTYANTYTNTRTHTRTQTLVGCHDARP